MRVPTIVALLMFLPLPVSHAAAQSGDAQAGKALWDGNTTMCRNCHGNAGEGGFGPDLAGRKLTVAQFTQALRRPWGVMPAFVESQINAKDIADLLAYFDSLPPVAAPGAWRFEVPASAPIGQQHAIATAGCAQCHGVTLNNPRMDAGAVNADFEWFKAMVYTHTASMPAHMTSLGETVPPRLRMGNFSPNRLPESVLQEIWAFTKGLGFRPKLAATLSAPVASPAGVTYTLTVENEGLADRGLTAEDLTITLFLPDGADVVATTGAGYQGVSRVTAANTMANAAMWKLATLGPRKSESYTITLSQPGTQRSNVRGTLSWTKPVVATGPTDSINIAPAPLPAPSR